MSTSETPSHTTDDGSATTARVSPELLRKLDIPAPRYTSYPTVPVWSDDHGSDDHVAISMLFKVPVPENQIHHGTNNRPWPMGQPGTHIFVDEAL